MLEQRWIRIIPAAFVMYTIAFIDRTNISLALRDISVNLQMDPAQAGGAAGAFFWGYSVLQIPGGYLANRWSAKRVVTVLLIIWGLCAVACGFVRTRQELWAMRFLLGVAEGGVWPAMLVLLANWFPRVERARANALWMLCVPLAIVFSSPLSGWILSRWNWRALLIMEGVLPFVWLPIWWALVEDLPSQARWLSSEAREHLEHALSIEENHRAIKLAEPIWRTLLQRQILVLVAINFLMSAANYGFLFWLPSVIQSVMTVRIYKLGVLFALPYVPAAIGMILLSFHSDRKRERRWHVAAGLCWGGLFLLAALLSSRYSLTLAYVLICLVGIGSWGVLGPFWAIPTEDLPMASAGSAMGFINAVGNLGGYAGPELVGHLTKATGNHVGSFGSLGLILLLSAGMVFSLSSSPHSGGRRALL